MQDFRNNPRVLIIRNAYAYDFGGGERFPVSLSTELLKHNYRPVIISRSTKLLELANEQKIHNVRGWWCRYQNFSGWRAVLFPLYIVWQLGLVYWYLSMSLRLKPSVLHPQSRDDFVAATFAGKLLGKRVVWTDHADLKYIFQNHTVWYKNPVGKLVYLASKLADHITLVSQSEKRLIEKQLEQPLPNKYTVIHNGVADRLEELTSAPNKNFITFVATSRLVISKGIGELIQAFQSIESSKNIRLWILGEGPDEQQFRRQAKDNKKISFLGFPEDALRRVAEADIFVHPSYHEGFSISLVEAAMLGKPLIACTVGGNSEIVTNNLNGLLVAPRNSEALNQAMTKLLKNQAVRKKMGDKSRAIYLADFVFAQIVQERFLPLYEK